MTSASLQQEHASASRRRRAGRSWGLLALVITLFTAYAAGLQPAEAKFSNAKSTGTNTWAAAPVWTGMLGWGHNNANQLTAADSVPHPSPLLVLGDWATTNPSVASGTNYTCAITSDRSLWCWGNNNNGRLGVGDAIDRSSPTRVGTDTNWSKVITSASTTCAIKNDQSLWCWGLANNYGQVGQGDTVDRNAPTKVGTSTWLTISGGTDHFCGIKTDNTLWCWGVNNNMQLGTGDYTTLKAPTNTVAGNWTAVAAGFQHTCAVKSDATLWCWGANGFGELGQGNSNGGYTTPIQVSGTQGYAKVSAGYGHTCATKTNGTLWCWGWNGNGQLGLGDYSQHLVPTQVGSATDWIEIAAHGGWTAGRRASNAVYTWGGNGNGELGQGDTNGLSTPTVVAGLVSKGLSIGSAANTCFSLK